MYYTSQGTPVARAKPGDMHDYRFWFDRGLAKWCITPANDQTGVRMLVVDRLQLCEVDAQSSINGTMIAAAELIADGKTLRLGDNCYCATAYSATLRLLRVYDQVVAMPVIGAVGAACNAPR